MSAKTRFGVLETVSKFCISAEQVGFTPELLELLAQDTEFLRDVLGGFRFKLRQGNRITPVSDEERDEIALKKLLDTPVEDCRHLNVRAANSLRNSGIRTVRDLVELSQSEILLVRNFGKNSIPGIKLFLEENNLNFSMRFTETEIGVMVADPGKACT